MAKLESLLDLTYELQYENIEEYYDYAKLGFEQALADQDSNFVSAFLIEMGYYFKYKGNYQMALNDLKRSLIICEKNNYLVNTAKTYTALGTVYHELGFYDKALDCHSKSLIIKEKLGDRAGIGVSFNNIGLIYYKIDDPHRAIDYYERSIAIKLEFGDTSKCIVPYINLGLAYSAQKMEGRGNRQAILNFKRAIDYSIKYDQQHRLGFAYNGIAQAFINEDNYDTARYYLQLSNNQSIKNDYRQLESSNYFLLSKLSFQEGDYNQAIQYLNRSQGLLKQLGDKNRIKNNYGLYSEIYAAQNLLDSAYYYQKWFSIMKDSIFNEELANNLANVQIATIEEQSQRKIADQEEANKRTRMFMLFLASILLLSIALIVVIFRNNARMQKINKQLSESRNEIQDQKEDLEKKNDQLAEAHNTIQRQNDVLTNINQELDKKVQERTLELDKSNRGLEKAVRDLDQFIYKTSHDLRGPIATMQGIINLGMIESKEPVSMQYFSTLNNVSNNLNNVLYRLIEVHETYLKKPVFELVDPIKEIKDVAEKIGGYLNDSSLTIVTELSAEGPWITDKHLYRLIIDSMLRSAYHYKDRKDFAITIKSSRNAFNMTILIEDNGYGIKPGDEDKVFNIFFKGSPRSGGTGLELYTTKIAVDKLKGMIRLVKPAKDTIFEIILPVLSA
ncbi:MAG: tetratricopeptide repeat protein [Cyclobacteriaceae bacterium]|nr:tetratricopeptide repeat protein [Cyclobacteriaceae bacterium]